MAHMEKRIQNGALTALNPKPLFLESGGWSGPPKLGLYDSQ